MIDPKKKYIEDLKKAQDEIISYFRDTLNYTGPFGTLGNMNTQKGEKDEKARMTDTPPLEEIFPEVPGKILGWRSFRIDKDDILSSLFINSGKWMPGVNKAICKFNNNQQEVYNVITGEFSFLEDPFALPDHDAPHSDCHCGLYGYHEYNLNLQQGNNICIALILAWGEIDLHSTGFRAEYAEIKALVYNNGSPDSWENKYIVTKIAKKYGVPAICIDDAEREAELIGLPIDVSLRPTINDHAINSFYPLSYGPEIYGGYNRISLAPSKEENKKEKYPTFSIKEKLEAYKKGLQPHKKQTAAEIAAQWADKTRWMNLIEPTFSQEWEDFVKKFFDNREGKK